MSERCRLFLDTTVQIDRLFEKPDRKAAICKTIEGADCSTSTLVLREFKARVIDGCISLYYIIEECDSDPDVLTEISRQFSKSRLSMLLKIYSEVKREAGLGDRFDKELALATVRAYITGRLLRRFRKGLVEAPSDLTRCEVAAETVQDSDGMFEIEVHCNREKASCELPRIYRDNEQHLLRIRGLVAGESERRRASKLGSGERRELETINRAYSDVRERGGWHVVMGQQNCDRLADLTVLIESPMGSAVYTTDKDYECLFKHLCFPDKNAPKIERYGA